MERVEKLQLAMYAAIHFLVDFCCALLLLWRICPSWEPAEAIFIYNLFAFAVQMPAGLLADRLGHAHVFAALGCALVLLGFLIQPGLLAVIAAGLGNAAFHVGGGLHTLNVSRDLTGPLGLFVSPGAFGIYLGSLSAFSGMTLPACILLAAAFVLLLIFGRGKANMPLALPPKSGGLMWASGCLLAVVILRSLLGLAADLPWKADYGWLLVCAVAFGKTAGGFLADRFRQLPAALLSLGGASLCFLFGSYPVPGLAALFLFNMTMPLTLKAAADLFPGMKGFSFGLLTFGLFLGFLPVYFGYGRMPFASLALGCAVSLPLLILGLKQAERREHDIS